MIWHLKMFTSALVVNVIPKRVIAMALVRYCDEPEKTTVLSLFGELLSKEVEFEMFSKTEGD